MRLRALLLLLFVIVAGCGKDEPAAEATPLTGTVVATGEYLGQPSGLTLAGNHIVVTDRSAPFVHVLSAADGTHLVSFGQQGSGPGEFRSATKVLADASGDGSFWVYDLSQSRISRFAMPAGAAVPRLDQTLNLSPAGPAIFFHPAWLNDSTLVSSGIYPDGRIAVADRRGTIVRYIGKRPPSPAGRDVPITVLQHAFTGPITLSPDRRRIAMSTENADRLEIYRPDGSLVREVRGAAGFDPVYEVHSQPAGNTMATGMDLRFGYTGLASTDEHIFAMYSGQLRGDGVARAFFGREVHVYDWAGDRVATVALDGPARAIAVTRDGRQLYAVQWDPEPRIVRYLLDAHL
jgi:hypothetical protein